MPRSEARVYDLGQFYNYTRNKIFSPLQNAIPNYFHKFYNEATETRDSVYFSR